MKILVFSWRDPKHPQAGGAEQVLHEHMKGWLAAGHSVVLFTSLFKGATGNETLDGITIIRYGFQYLGVHVAAFFWYLFGKHPKFDLVVDQFHGIPFFTTLYVRVPKLAVLQEVAREVWLINQLPRPFNWIIGYLGYLLEPFIFLLYRRVHFMVGSNSAKDDLIKFRIPANNIFIIPHGVIVKKPNPMPKKESKKTVIFLGALTRDKGIEDAIRAFAILDKKWDYNFWIVGKGPPDYTNYLKKLVEILSITKKVRFFGFVSTEEKFELLAKAHLLVNPSIREGWGLVNIEANSMGTPVVAYKSPGLVDSVNQGVSGIFVKKNTPEALAETIYSVLTDTKRLAKMSRTAISWSKQFSWKKTRVKSLRLVQRVSGSV